MNKAEAKQIALEALVGNQTRTPHEWCKVVGVYIMSLGGWLTCFDKYGPRPVTDHISWEEFKARLARSRIVSVQGTFWSAVERESRMILADDGPTGLQG